MISPKRGVIEDTHSYFEKVRSRKRKLNVSLYWWLTIKDIVLSPSLFTTHVNLGRYPFTLTTSRYSSSYRNVESKITITIMNILLTYLFTHNPQTLLIFVRVSRWVVRGWIVCGEIFGNVNWGKTLLMCFLEVKSTCLCQDVRTLKLN